MLAKFITRLKKEFDNLTQYVFETSATTWYGSDLEGTKFFLKKVIEIALEDKIEIPNTSVYVNEPITDMGNWGPPLSCEQLIKWQETI